MWWSQSGFMGIANHKMVLGLHCLFFSADKTCLESSFRIWYDSSTKYTSPFFLTKIWHFAYKLDKEILRQLVVVITLAKYCRIHYTLKHKSSQKIQFRHILCALEWFQTASSKSRQNKQFSAFLIYFCPLKM